MRWLQRGDHPPHDSTVAIVDRPGLVVLRDTVRPEYPAYAEATGAETILLTPADTIYLLAYQGESFWTVWFRGKQFDAADFWLKETDRDVVKKAVQLREPDSTDWIRVRLSDKTTGWMIAPFGFSGTADHYGDDVELCYPPAPPARNPTGPATAHPWPSLPVVRDSLCSRCEDFASAVALPLFDRAAAGSQVRRWLKPAETVKPLRSIRVVEAPGIVIFKDTVSPAFAPGTSGRSGSTPDRMTFVPGDTVFVIGFHFVNTNRPAIDYENSTYDWWFRGKKYASTAFWSTVSYRTAPGHAWQIRTIGETTWYEVRLRDGTTGWLHF